MNPIVPDDAGDPGPMGLHSGHHVHVEPAAEEWNPGFLIASMMDMGAGADAWSAYDCWREGPPDPAADPKVETWRDRPPML